MKTKADILARQKSIIFELLTRKYKFMHDQLIAEAKPELVKAAKDWFDDELQSMVNDGIHTEHMGGHNSATSGSLDFEETSEFFDSYKETLALIDEIYAEGDK